MLEWFKAHPDLQIAIFVAIITAIFNFATKPRTPEQLAKLPPRLAAFLRLMNAVFPDPEKTIEAVWQAWKNTHDRLPSKK